MPANGRWDLTQLLKVSKSLIGDSYVQTMEENLIASRKTRLEQL